MKSDSHGPSEYRVAPDRMDDVIRAAVAQHGGPLEGHILGHFELIAELHSVDDPDAAPIRVRWSPSGSSPHLSLGLLRGACARLENQLGQA